MAYFITYFKLGARAKRLALVRMGLMIARLSSQRYEENANESCAEAPWYLEEVFEI